MITNYATNGIVANHISTSDNNKLNIVYDGLLYKSGADAIYAHYGYGAKWTNNNILKMTKTEEGFKIDIPLLKTGVINVAFKDSAENWDNNNGTNYTFTLRARK